MSVCSGLWAEAEPGRARGRRAALRLPLLGLFGAHDLLGRSQVPGGEWQWGQGGGDGGLKMGLSWEEAWVWPGSRGLQGPLSAVWDSSLHSWCLKTIRQRPSRPGPPRPGPRWAAVSKTSAKTSAKTVGSLRGGPCWGRPGNGVGPG